MQMNSWVLPSHPEVNYGAPVLRPILFTLYTSGWMFSHPGKKKCSSGDFQWKKHFMTHDSNESNVTEGEDISPYWPLFSATCTPIEHVAIRLQAHLWFPGHLKVEEEEDQLSSVEPVSSFDLGDRLSAFKIRLKTFTVQLWLSSTVYLLSYIPVRSSSHLTPN